MAAILATTVLVVAASLAAGSLVLALSGERGWSPLAGAVGFGALTIACPLLIRLPGRATTAATLILVLAVGAALLLRRRGAPQGVSGAAVGSATTRPELAAAAATAIAVVALGCLPFLANDQVGILGEGIYTNDQAAQLYWTDWLERGFGPEPSAVRFGYPTGPQAVTATAARTLGVDLDDAFNGLLLSIAALAGLAALAALRDLPPVRRVVVASLAGMPYLAASFLAQSAFKEMAMAMLFLAFAVALERDALARGGARAVAAALLAGAAFFTYSVPGLVWFAGALVAWLALELVVGRLRPPLGEWRAAARRHRRLAAGAVAVVVALAVLGALQGAAFVDKIGNVQASAGRLSSPVWPGEALGVWPEGDFRLVRGEVSGAYPATLFGLLVIAAGALIAWRRRRFALLGALGTAAVVYLGSRAFASIYVEAKALAVIAPLVALVGLGGLLAPAAAGERGPWRWRAALGIAGALALAISTLLALRQAPVGLPDRGEELEQLAARAEGETVAFLGVDRFAGYWLRETLAMSPGGYVPAEIRARHEKVWQQGTAMDLDTLPPRKLNRFDYAITTSAAYQSTPPPGMTAIARTASYLLWHRTREVPPNQVLRAAEAKGPAPEDGAPGATLDCAGSKGERLESLPGTATVLPEPVLGKAGAWSPESSFDAGGGAHQALELPPGRWDLSLQYHSQVPLTLRATGAETALPASLVGMYLTDFEPGHPQDSFWPAGEVRVTGGRRTTITVSADEPSGLQDALGVPRKVWLGQIAATRVGAAGPDGAAGARDVPLRDACGRYVDRFAVKRRG